MPSDLMEVDKPLHDEACWFRFLTNADHITSDKTLHYQALKGAQFSLATAKPWQHELSGVVAEIVGSADQIRERGEARLKLIHANLAANGKRAPSKIRFVGVACAKASKLRIRIGSIDADTAYTPESENAAHSDLVTFSSSTDESIEPIRHWLMKTLRIVLPSEIEGMVENC
jgi:hypothetical protein